jgi:dephospho-CoA kinase
MIEKCNQFEKHKILLLVIPLLFEAKFTDLCTEIWLVKCPREIQKKRLMSRNKISDNEAEKIINLQLNFEDKSKFSDVILDNSDNQKLWINKIQELV